MSATLEATPSELTRNGKQIDGDDFDCDRRDEQRGVNSAKRSQPLLRVASRMLDVSGCSDGRLKVAEIGERGDSESLSRW